MLSNFFKKSTPFNYAIIITVLLLIFFIYQFNFFKKTIAFDSLIKAISMFCLILLSMLITDFIAKKNHLIKNNAYNSFIYILFLLFFPNVLGDFNILAANFFMLLSFRRLVSLDSQKQTKEKIFDATFWILLATLFHFWSIIFIALVYLSILFNVANDYKNWLVPLVAFGVIAVLFLLFSLIFQINLNVFFESKMQKTYTLDYFSNPFENWAFSVYITASLFFFLVFIFSFSRLALQSQSAYKKLLSFLIISGLFFVLSPLKSNSLLLFSVFPMTILATNYIETTNRKAHQDFVLFSLCVFSFFSFFTQIYYS